MNLRLYLSLLFSLCILLSSAQKLQLNVPSVNSETEMCHIDQVMKPLMDNPDFAAKREAANTITRNILDQSEMQGNRSGDEDLYSIPVVFHVIHKGEAIGSGTNISDAQILSAVDALNRDFSASSADGGIAQSSDAAAAGNTNIQFCLASLDPDGNGTNGIVRVNGTSVIEYSTEGINDDNQLAVKNLSRWDNRYYLNIWVVSEIYDNDADLPNPDNFLGGTLGYAYYPVSPVTDNSALDGIVAINLCVGNDPTGSEGFRLAPFTLLNRTLTHEVGHFLNLAHTFEGESCTESNCSTQGDKVCDTPPTTLNFDCDLPACSGTQQVENYLDYTGDACYNMFSEGQKSRMRATLEGVRWELINTNNCINPYEFDVSIEVLNSSVSACSEGPLTPEVELRNLGTANLTSATFMYQFNGGTVNTYNWTGSLNTGASDLIELALLDPEPGENIFAVELNSTSLNNTQTDENDSNNEDVWSYTPTSGTEIQLTIIFDDYSSETTWDLRNEANEILLQGGPYGAASPLSIQEIICLPVDCYSFTINDSYGDGICCEYGEGSFQIENLDSGEILGSGGSFSYSDEVEFCISDEEVGCTATSTDCLQFITEVTLADEVFLTACDNYFLNQDEIALIPGEEYTLIVETQDETGEFIGYTDDQVAAWIDWNGDGNFNGPGENIFTATYEEGVAYPNTQVFTVPNSTEPGTIIMRVRMGNLEDGPIDPCGITLYGEVEDYTLAISNESGGCEASSENCDEYITQVSLAGQEFSSGCTNYSLNNNIISLNSGEEYSLVIETENEDGFIGYIDDQVAAWIDWNADGDFDDSGEWLFTTTYSLESDYPNTHSFTVPENAFNGTIIMRVRMSHLIEDGAISPCGTSTWGEVEDYSIEVIDAEGILTLLNTPDNTTISCEMNSGTSALGSVTANTTCNIDDDVSISHSDEIIEGDCDNEWTIIRTWLIEDACNNSTNYEQEIYVSDNIAPVVDCSITTASVSTTEAEAAIPDFTNEFTAEDNCSDNLLVEQVPAAGTMRPLGDHDIIIMAHDDCGNTGECVIQLSITDVNGLEDQLGGEIQLFPNPTNGKVVVQFPKNIQGNVFLEIYAISGKLIFSEKINDKISHQIDISEAANGFYLLQIRTDRGLAVKKLTKQ